MKHNISKVFLFSCLAMALASCDDQLMEWGTPDGHGQVTTAEIPLAVKEVIANYDNIKAYAPAGNLIGIGMGADMYVANAKGEGTLANANYQLFTPGNAMKMGVVAQANGSLKFETIDKLIDALKENNMPLYGHNFIWHTQQPQTYLRALIAPTLVVESSSDIQTIIPNGDFETGDKTGWNSWGNGSTTTVTEEAARNGKYGLKMENPSEGTDYYVAQLKLGTDDPLEVGKTYVIRFNAKASTPASVQFCVQDEENNGDCYRKMDISTAWNTIEYEYTCTKPNMIKVYINFGKVPATYYIDDVEFGPKKESPDAGRKNLIKNFDFAEDIVGWSKYNGADGCNTWNADEGNSGAGCLQVVNALTDPGNQWKTQIHVGLIEPIAEGSDVYISYYIKTAGGNGSVRCSTTGKAHYQGDQTVGSDWMRVEWTFKAGGEIDGLNFDLAAVPNTYYIDDVVVSTDPFNASAKAKTRASKMYYVLKTPEEKREALLGAMDSWIKGMADHLKETGVQLYGYDVINEPINDGDCKVRGVDNVFGGSWTEDNGKVTKYDAEPVESEEEGLNLNWSTQVGNSHFYWGYYVKDYAVQAFQMARKYLPAETKLFVNDYNLESTPKKLEALIKFAQDIDAANGSPIVDGIGTQMHVSISPTDDTEKNAKIIAELKAKVDAQFQTMAATGKLVRVTELDITLGTGSPSSAQYQAQADAYRVIAESYLENVPAAQQSGITIWSLSDNEDEHGSWLKGQVPNLFDKDYKRKWAYKGFCDGLVGEDLGLKYGGEDYKAFYERNNVSSTVK